MTERTFPPNPSSSPPHASGGRPPAAGDRELVAVMARAARVRNGLALLQSAPPESAAVLLGVAPPAIERARRALAEWDDLDGHAASLASGATGATGAAGWPGWPGQAAPPRPPAPRDPGQLLDAARGRPDGLTLLYSASPEAAAIAFGVHPDLVHAAREFASRRAGRQPS